MSFETSIEYAEKRGAEMYRDGATISDNPHDRVTQPELFDAWNRGFRSEQNYWESEL